MSGAPAHTANKVHSRNGVPVVDADDFRTPFVWFGGKRSVAAHVWERFGNPINYVEPFFGSGAVLLARPAAHRWWERFEVANDQDAYVTNFFRAMRAAPDEVVGHAANPVSEVDLTARHVWLVQTRPDLTARLMADPDAYDTRAAGWWAWGVCSWVAGDWCTGVGGYRGNGPATLPDGTKAPGVYRKIPMMSGDHGGKGVNRPRPVTGAVPSDLWPGSPDVDGSQTEDLMREFRALANRLRRVRFACGDFMRVLRRPAQTAGKNVTGVFLDPPYAPAERRGDLYGVGDRHGAAAPADGHPADRARVWALDNGADPKFRIAYCGYDSPASDLFEAAGWNPHHWTTAGGYALSGGAENRSRANMSREVIWFSPHCLNPETAPMSLFDSPGDLSEPPEAQDVRTEA